LHMLRFFTNFDTQTRPIKQMKAKIYCILLAIAISSPCFASIHYNTDSILKVLDAVIDSTAYYETTLQSQLGKHRAVYENSNDITRKLQEASFLFYKYRRFRVDSAMYFARERVKLTKELNDPDSIALARINEADAMKRLGRFADAKATLDAIPHTDYIYHSAYYYDVYFSILNSMSRDAVGEEEKAAIKELCRLYRDSVKIVNVKSELEIQVNNAEILKRKVLYNDAADLLLKTGKAHHNEMMNYAIYWAVLADTYDQMGETEGAKYCYAMSAIIDKKNCNKTYTSLQNLAALLFKEGDTDRAHRYITLSMSDVKEANALSRLSLVGEYLPIITTAYEKKQKAVAVRRVLLIVVTSIVAIVLGVLLMQLVRRTKKLAMLRRQLAENNDKLHSLNEALAAMNKELEENNIIKEVYIGQLFNLCSNYIGQIENYRTSLISKLKSGRIKDMEKTLSQETTNSQLKSLFKSFDQVFLEIFPNFIENFNSLLRPEERIYPKPGELLSPELRIYALVRLGINDSTKIAEFLHYSVQTVYNYRQKTRNKAIISRQEFIDRVKTI